MHRPLVLLLALSLPAVALAAGDGHEARSEPAAPPLTSVIGIQTPPAPLTSGIDQEITREYLAKCVPAELASAGARAYRLLEQLMADDRLIGEEGALAFDARGELMGEDACWPDGRPELTPLVNDYSYPPSGSWEPFPRR
jgi:hypothetical protein